MIRFFIEIVIFLTAPVFESPWESEAVRIPVLEECRKCHADKMDQKVSHEAIENGCDICHESTGEAHPEDGVKGFTLTASIPELCYYCHEEAEVFSSGHQPVIEGDCFYCHDVHGSSNPALILMPEQELCLTCHQVIQGKEVLHSAIEAGGCIMCHQAHGSEFRELLSEPYPEEDYPVASIDSFGLCFLCHDSDLMEAEETEWATNFREGIRNLHRVHIQGEKGRNCKFCHNMHGSNQPFLIEDRIPFGNWEMQMNFITTDEGGSCMPGCHGKKAYSRLKQKDNGQD